MTLKIGPSSSASAVDLLLTDPILRAYETCLDTSTGVITLGDGTLPWSQLPDIHQLGMAAGGIPALIPPRLTPDIYICHDDVTIPCILGEPITNSHRTGYSIFVHDKNGKEIYSNIIETTEEISAITITRADLNIPPEDVAIVSVHCKSFGWGDGGSGYSGASNSVLVICAPDAVTEFGHINTVTVDLLDGVKFKFSDIITGTSIDTLTTRITITHNGETVVNRGTLDYVEITPLPQGLYSYTLEVLAGEIVVSQKTGSFSIPNIIIPVTQILLQDESAISILTEFPRSPYINDRVIGLTVVTITDGSENEIDMPLSHTYTISVPNRADVEIALRFKFEIYPEMYVTNGTTINVPSPTVSTSLTASTGNWSVPISWFDNTDTVSVDIIAIGCGGDGGSSASEFTYGTAGAGGAYAWITNVQLTKGVAYPYSVGGRDIISNGISSFSDLIVAYPGASGVTGGVVVPRAAGGTYVINTNSNLYTELCTYGGGNGGDGGGNGINAGGGGGCGGPDGNGGDGGTENTIFYKTSGGKGGAGGAPRCGGGGCGIKDGISGLSAGAAGHGGYNGDVYISGEQRPDGGTFGGGGGGANSLFDHGRGGRGTIFIKRSNL